MSKYEHEDLVLETLAYIGLLIEDAICMAKDSAEIQAIWLSLARTTSVGVTRALGISECHIPAIARGLAAKFMAIDPTQIIYEDVIDLTKELKNQKQANEVK